MSWKSKLIGVLALAAIVPGDAPASTLLVANKTDGTVDLVDPRSGESRATLPTGKAPHEVAVSPDGRLAAISNYGDRDEPGSTLTLIDIERSKVAATIKLRKHERPHGLVWYKDDRLAVTTEGSAHLIVVDPQRRKIVESIPTAQRISHMVAVTPDGKRAFVANIGSGSVTAVDLAAGEKLGDIKTGAGAEGIGVTPDGREVWVGNRGMDTLSIIDVDTLEVLQQLPCKGFPIRVVITPDGRRALVSCARTGEVAVFDVKTRRELLRRKLDLSNAPDAATRLFGDRFGESPVPVGVVVSADSKRAWVAATQADAVVVIDVETLDVLDLIEVGKEPDGMALSPVGAGAAG